ncbi:MAG: pentapeptide repeat-containing protein, partial [Anaplasmataceae bacterium]|nr:pentapeptide repeat-containing protein [Anaplasmataceae bacterium]
MKISSLFSLLYSNNNKNHIIQNVVIKINEEDYNNLFKKSKIKKFNSYKSPIRGLLGKVEFHNVVFVNCNFKSFFFQHNKFINCSFKNCSFNFTIFLECDFQNTAFEKCFFIHCNFHDTLFD